MELLLAALALFLATDTTAPPTAAPQSQMAMVCLKSGEAEDGLNKICYYDCAGSSAAITVKSFQLCPMTINN